LQAIEVANALNAPSAFTLDTQHYGSSFASGEDVISAAGSGNLFTLILGDSTTTDSFGGVTIDGYPTVHIVANGPGGSIDSLTSLLVIAPAHSNTQVIISSSAIFSNAIFSLGNTSSAHEGVVSVAVFLAVPSITAIWGIWAAFFPFLLVLLN
jgi:hypothetical protein